MKISFRSFSLPILAVVVLLLAIGMLGRQFLAAAPAVVTETNWDEIKVVEGKQHGPRQWRSTTLNQLPPLPSGENVYTWDFTNADLSNLDLTQQGKDPGLGLRALHQQGITGQGVHVAILDQTLLSDHQEYAGRIIKYTEVGDVAPESELHGAAVASLLAGKQVGVAPEAQVTYYAIQVVKDWNGKPIQRTFRYMAAAINKILDDNKNLPAEKRIQVISASIGAGPDEDGYAEVNQAYQRAVKEGVLVVSGSWWADYFFRSGGQSSRANVYAPMDSRTVAAPTGLNHYRFDRTGGLSWSVPWMAGVYALACQVNPKVTPEQFLQAAHDTGDTITVTRDGKEYTLGPIMNPAKIIAAVKK